MRPVPDWFEYKEALELRFIKLFNPFEGGNRKKISGSSDFRQKTKDFGTVGYRNCTGAKMYSPSTDGVPGV